jgi:RNA polymerase sigma factor (sigma-70 family)
MDELASQLTGETTKKLAERFEEHRPHLHGIARRMLGPAADDAVQETWLRLSRTDPRQIEDLRAWLTTVLARVCLNALRARSRRGEQPLEAHRPDPVVGPADPEPEAVLADSVGLALQVVLDTLTPAERLAFVLHDVFGFRFEEIAPLLGRSLPATRQLASRGRRRVRDTTRPPGADRSRQREAVDAFLAAARDGDFDRLVGVLHPDVLLRADTGPGPVLAVRGAAAVAGRALMFSDPTQRTVPALVDGRAGLVTERSGTAVSVLSFTVAGGRVVAIDLLADPDRLARLDLRAVLAAST